MGLCIKVTLTTTLFVGLAMVVTGVVILVLVFPKMIDDKISEALPIVNGTETQERFVKSPVPTYMSFYIYNVTNKHEVNTINGTKPILQQVGPYVYRQEKEKNISSFDSKLGTVTYTEHTNYFFEKDMSTGSLDDPINYVHAVALVMATLGITSPGEDLIATNTVNELLFEGMDLKQYLPESFRPICNGFIPGCRFGFYFDKNDTDSEEYEVATGELTLKNIGEILNYKKKRELDYWTGDTCNALNGSDGKQFPPGVDQNEDLYVFSSDICRSLKIKYDKDVTHRGIDALRYVVPAEVFADPNTHKYNLCFCPVAVNDTCPSKAGVIPLGKCLQKSGLDPERPVFASSPHFYLGEDEYWKKFVGLNPDKEKHQTYLDIEPLTGTMISAAKRIQINLLIQPDKTGSQKFLQFVNEPFYFPVFWAEEAGVIDEKSAKEFREKVTNPMKTGKWSLVAVIIVGGILLLVVAIVGMIKCGKSSGGKQRV